MASNISLMVDNTSPAVSDTISFIDASDPEGTPVDLTDCTVQFQMRLLSSNTLKVDAAASITSAVGGAVLYSWVSGDTDTAGTYAAWFRVTFADSSVQDTPEFIVRIKEHAPLTGGYTTIAAVRDLLTKGNNDLAQDDLIADLILRYSRAIDDFTQVAWASEMSTKRFRFFGYTVSFSKYGLASATTVTLSPEASGGTVLVADQDYMLLPFNQENGVYTSLELNRLLWPNFNTLAFFGGMKLIDIEGTWGSTNIPTIIEYATAKAVADDFKRNIAFYTQGFANENASGGAAIFLQADVRAALQPYRKFGY